MAKITELEPSDSEETTPKKSSKESKGKLMSSKPVPRDQRPTSGSLKNTTGTLYINYIVLPIVIVIISVAVLFFSNQKAINQVSTPSSSSKKGIIMSATELAKHDGSDPNIPVYIVILGRIYDVEKGRRHYGKGSGYNVFAGRDSTPSFVTGMFSREKATDDVSGLSPEEMLGIKDWMDFYRKDYTYVGKVIGRYYDENGKPTDALKQAKALIKEGKRLKDIQKGEDKKFPPCNSKWSQTEGAEVWCSKERQVHKNPISLFYITKYPEFFKPFSLFHLYLRFLGNIYSPLSDKS